jgi:phosphatidylinositol glycan class B
MIRSSSIRRASLQTRTFLVIFALSFHLLTAVNIRGTSDIADQDRLLDLARARTVQHAGGNLTSEFRQKDRPALQIVIASYALQGDAEIGITNRFAQVALLRIISALLGISLSLMLYRTYRGQCTSEAAKTWLLSLLLLLWFLTPIHASFTPEAWSGMLFFLGLAWFLRRDRLEDASNILAGLPLGLSLFFRFESGIMIGGFLGWLWFAEREHARVLLTLILGMVFGSLMGVLADRQFYGEWIFTPWNSFAALITDGPAPSAGTTPWWFYFDQIVRYGIYPIGALVLISGLIFFVVLRTEVLTWVVVPYVVIHMILPGKDLRFLYPVASAVPVMLFLSMQRAYSWIRPEQTRQKIGRVLTWVVQPLWGINLVFLVALSLLPVDAYTPFYQRISNERKPQQMGHQHQNGPAEGRTYRQDEAKQTIQANGKEWTGQRRTRTGSRPVRPAYRGYPSTAEDFAQPEHLTNQNIEILSCASVIGDAYPQRIFPFNLGVRRGRHSPLVQT